MDPAFRGISARAAGDDEMIARLERVSRKPGLFETPRVGPFGGNLLRLPVFVHDCQMEPGVRILQLKSDDIAFDGYLLFLEVLSRERVMG